MKSSKRYILSPYRGFLLRTVQVFVISLIVIIPKLVKIVRKQGRYFFFATNLEFHEPFFRSARTV